MNCRFYLFIQGHGCVISLLEYCFSLFFLSSRRRHTRCALVTGFRRVLFRSARKFVERHPDEKVFIVLARCERPHDCSSFTSRYFAATLCSNSLESSTEDRKSVV